MVSLILALLLLQQPACARAESQPGTFGAPYVALLAPPGVAYAAPVARVTTEAVAGYQVTLTQGLAVSGAFALAEAEAPFTFYLCRGGATPTPHHVFLPHVEPVRTLP